MFDKENGLCYNYIRNIVFAGWTMSNKDVREYASNYFLPFLLGSNRRSHKLSAKILRKYGIVSLILDEDRSVYDFFALSSNFVLLCQTQENPILAHELSAIAQRYDYTLPILIPCSQKYAELVEKLSDKLEPEFVICEFDKVFSDSPLADIP